MVYPDTRCWALAPNTLDPELYNTKRGIIPLAFSGMIDRVKGDKVIELTEWLDN